METLEKERDEGPIICQYMQMLMDKLNEKEYENIPLSFKNLTSTESESFTKDAMEMSGMLSIDFAYEDEINECLHHQVFMCCRYSVDLMLWLFSETGFFPWSKKDWKKIKDFSDQYANEDEINNKISILEEM